MQFGRTLRAQYASKRNGFFLLLKGQTCVLERSKMEIV
jgi:hypothetical protein